MRSVWFPGWFIVAAGVGLWRCSIDDRSPSEVMAPNQPSEGSAAGSSGAMSNGGTAAPPNQGGGSDPGGSTPGGGTPGGGEPGSSGAGSSGAGAGNGSTDSNPDGVGSPPGAAGSGGMINMGAAGSSGVPVDGEPGMGMSGATGNSGGPPGDGSAPTISSSCPAFTACGGELTGTWAYTVACPVAAENLVGSLMIACPTAAVQFERGAGSALSFNSGQVARSGTPVGDSVLTLPPNCTLLSCADLAAAAGGDARCGVTNGECICRFASSVDWSQQSYTVSGSQLTQADGRTFDYCVAGNTLTYRETGDAKEPGVFTLQRN